MLHSLHIENYILIDSLDIQFPEGLVIITGQTGAGKSILLGALSLLFGAKADASMVSEGAQSCVVEAEFDVRSAGHLTIRRVIYSSGRSRSFVNDCPVQLSALQNLADRLIDIHSQHKSLLLSDRKFQLSVLDYFAGSSATLSRCRSAWHELQTLRAELGRLEESKARAEAEHDYRQAQYDSLREAGLKPGELEELEAEHRTLANAGQIASALSQAWSLLDESRESSGNSMLHDLKEAGRQLEKISSFQPATAELASRIESARIELEDIAAALADLLSGATASPARLEQVEQRISQLYSLLKRHSCTTVEELIELRDRYASQLGADENLGDDISQLRSRLMAAQQNYDAQSSALHAMREKAAPGLSKEVEDSLRFLELDNASFEATVEPCEPGADGADRTVFRFSSTGGSLQELSKVASGGEISRIMLCLKALMAKFVGMPTLIFDEIDTGVSGSVADKMGRMICRMGRDMQVFSITHLPQVAAKGDAHYIVSKSTRPDGRTVSGIRKAEGEERVHEIARLLSGSVISEAALANARTLIDEGRA